MTLRDFASSLFVFALIVTPASARHAEFVAQDATVPVFALDPDVFPPVVISRVDAIYPDDATAKEAIAKKVPRDVWLEGVVEADGTLSGVRVSRGINPEFDRRALEAASKWKFNPGIDKKSNKPVRVHVQLDVAFRVTPAPEEFGQGAHKQGEPGLVMPVLKKNVDPLYPQAAMKAKVQGEVEVEAVVLEDGTVGDIRVTKALDSKFGLDDSAVLAVKRWVFEPAKLHGTPVSALCKMTLEFRLR